MRYVNGLKESGAKKQQKKQQHSNHLSKKNKAQLHHFNNHSYNITHLDLATQMKKFNVCMHR